MKKRCAFVTGAAAGLGAGIAWRLASRNYHLVLTHRPDGSAPMETLGRVRTFDAAVQSYEIDMADTASLAKLLSELISDGVHIDTLVHTVGPMHIGRFEQNDFATYEYLLAANLSSAVVLAQALLPAMREQKFGRMVFFGMTGSSVTRPAKGLALYGAAKAGLVAFARTLALEEAQHGITVNMIEPGDIRRKSLSRIEARALPAKNPSGHAGSWEDIADAVCYLVSDEAAFVNGATLAVGGGLVDASE